MSDSNFLGRDVVTISKSSIDKLGERLKSGGVDDDDLRLLDSFRRSFFPAYERVQALVGSLPGNEPTGRPAKSTRSIVDKLMRETIRLSQMQDIAGCRLVVGDKAAQDNAVRVLAQSVGDVAVVDRRIAPSFGYRAVHLIVRDFGNPIEVQVRTDLQHLWAELSEKASDIIDPEVKYGGGPKTLVATLGRLSGMIQKVEDLEGRPVPPVVANEVGAIKGGLREALEGLTRDLAALKAKGSK